MKAMKPPKRYRIGLRHHTSLFVGSGEYHWVSGTPQAGTFTEEQAKAMIQHILTVTDEPEKFRREVRVVPVTGGWKETRRLLAH